MFDYSGMSYEQASREAEKVLKEHGWYRGWERLEALRSIMKGGPPMINQCAAIGFTKDRDTVRATCRMEAAITAIRHFITEHPEVFLVGPETEDTTFVFGPRARIKVE